VVGEVVVGELVCEEPVVVDRAFIIEFTHTGGIANPFGRPVGILND